MQLARERRETLSECKARVSEHDFRVFWVYSRHEPPLEDRLDWWMAQLIAAVLAPHRKPGQPALSAERIMPKRWPARTPSESTLVAKIKAWASSHNG